MPAHMHRHSTNWAGARRQTGADHPLVTTLARWAVLLTLAAAGTLQAQPLSAQPVSSLPVSSQQVSSQQVSSQGQPAQPQQTLTLFEEVETPAVPVAVSRAPEMNRGVPPFTLVGTSEFGDRQRARLRTAQGESITVELGGLGSTPIPGYPGYRIEQAEHRELVVRHPASAPCLEFTAQGVTCVDEYASHLSLITAQAIQPPVEPATEGRRVRRRGVPPEAAAQQPGMPQQQEAQRAQPDNPFAAALRAARERGEIPPEAIRDSRGDARFQPQRIDPSQVPEGARLVRTPFGDRIVRD